MKKKYILIGGQVQSHDGDSHYISPRKLAYLYRVDPKECYEARSQDHYSRGFDKLPVEIPRLYPQPSGLYNLPGT